MGRGNGSLRAALLGAAVIGLLGGCAAPRPLATPAPGAEEAQRAAPPPAPAPVNPAVLALLESAQAQQAQGRLDAAIDTLERALRIAPRDAALWHRLAQLYLDKGQPLQAESFARKSLALPEADRALRRANWQLIEQARLRLGDPAGARAAREAAQRD